MFSFIINNLSTIIVSLIIIAIVILIILFKINEKKKGNGCSSCKGCGQRYICKK